MSLSLSWWEKLLVATKDQLNLLKYEDPGDPTKNTLWVLNVNFGSRTQVDKVLETNEEVIHPYVYEQGTEYHQLVSNFLSMDLPLSCEYLELENKIIISYYLRSERGFDRFLLVIDSDGKLQNKVKQDHEMKGFAPGSFFVWNSKLIFVKDGNEVGISLI